MQKGRLGFIGLALGMILFSQTAMAGTCKEGEEFTGKNGHTYCVSNVQMNWWSAFNWCSAQGRHLASMDEICTNGNDRWLGGQANASCPNVIGMGPNKGSWSSLGKGTGDVYRVVLSSGSVYHNGDGSARHLSAYSICY